MTKRIAIGTLVFSVCMFLAWYAGFDLMSRGVVQAYWAFASIVVGLLAAIFPYEGLE